jgi:PadR family transcriptional regulator, regulatory protein PadR
MAETLPLLKGTLDLLVLKTLSWGPMHGFGITRRLEEHAEGEVEIDDSALYQALHRLEEKSLIEGTWGVTENGRRARYYRLTSTGRSHLRAETESWNRYARLVGRILALSPRSA